MEHDKQVSTIPGTHWYNLCSVHWEGVRVGGCEGVVQPMQCSNLTSNSSTMPTVDREARKNTSCLNDCVGGCEGVKV